MAPMTWLRRRVRWVGLGLILAASLGALGGTLVGGPASASGETGGSPAETGTSPTGTGTSNCPSSNPPNQMTLVAGTPQTAILQSAFATGLQVALTNSDGCPVTSAAAGIPVTFSAPVERRERGVLHQRVEHRHRRRRRLGCGRRADVHRQRHSGQLHPHRQLAVRLGLVLTDKHRRGHTGEDHRDPAEEQIRERHWPLPRSRCRSRCWTRTATQLRGRRSRSRSALAARAHAARPPVPARASPAGAPQATATTSASGVASSPLLTANRTTGSFTATAAVSGKEPSGGSGKENSAASGSDAATPVSFSLSNLAGKPTKLATGVGSTQSTTAGTPFPIRLAVTVTDAEKNPVPDAQVTFSAPTRGASGRFAPIFDRSSHGSHHHRSHVSHPDTVKVKANACGIAVAPAFTANHLPGGYIVKASVTHAKAGGVCACQRSTRTVVVTAAGNLAANPVNLAPQKLRPSDLARVASVGLRTRRMRAGLSALGIAIGVAAIVAVLGLSSSSQAGLLSEIERLGTNLLTVTNGQSFAGKTAELPLVAPAMIARIDPVENVAETGKVKGSVYRTPLIPAVDTNALSVHAASLGLLRTLTSKSCRAAT